MKKMLTFLIGLFVVLLVDGFAFGVELGVPFLPQVPPGDWKNPATKNCGPTSVIMVAAFHNGFTPAEQDIKKVDDWLVAKKFDKILVF